MRRLLMLLLVLSFGTAIAQKNYSVLLIPDSLRENANVVKRYEEIVFVVESPKRTREKTKVAYTIFNANGDKFGFLSEYYDQLRDLKTFDATLYDAFGKKVRSVRKSEIKDVSSVSDFSLMEDNRVKWFSFQSKDYPYTVEFETEVEMNHSFMFPVWCPIADEYMSVEESRFTVVSPKDFKIKYKLLGGSREPVMTANKDGEKEFNWVVANAKPIVREPYTSSWYTYSPTVITSPEQFQLQGYTGDMKTWESFGKFNMAMNDGRDVLPDVTKATVKKLTEGIKDNHEKIEILYRYLQNNFRYVSIQMGIGGWQPFEASFVDAKKYGDCKALSNYMHALLKEAGIESFYTVILAGDKPNDKFFLPDFPSNRFNHVILCVPNNKDTVWLECTSNSKAAGYMGDFTDDRYAFLITPQGGKLVRTPKYDKNDNLQNRHIAAQLDVSGNLKMQVLTNYRAMQQDDLHGMIHALSKDKVLEALKSELELPTYDVLKYDYQQVKDKLPVIKETLEIESPAYAQVSGKRMFVLPNIMNRTHLKPAADTSRQQALQFYKEYTDIDSVEIAMPVGYKLETRPKDMVLNSSFGSYETSVKFENDKLLYCRKIVRNSGSFPASAYNDWVKFCETIFKADRAKVVLVKKDE